MADPTAFRTTLTASPLLCTGRLLDNIPVDGDPYAAAFSLRKVNTAYKGPCIRIRRSSDNSETDIFFTQTDIDLQALVDFASGFDCYVTTWYDQSGRNHHAVQDDPDAQPQIVEKGLAITNKSENRVSMRFNGSSLNTSWQPTPTEMADGAGMLVSASAGIDGSTQGGTAVEYETSVITKTDYPNTFLPEGFDTFYFDGLKVTTTGGTEEIIYVEDSSITKLQIDPEDGPKPVGQYSLFHHSSEDTDEFLIEKNTEENKYPNAPVWFAVTKNLIDAGESVYFRLIGFSGEYYTVSIITDTDPTYYSATLQDGDGNKPVPPPDAILGVHVFTDRVPITKIPTSHPVPGGPPSLTVDTLPISDDDPSVNQWRRGAKANGRIFAVPYNAETVLEIDHKYSYVKSIKITEPGSGYDASTVSVSLQYSLGSGEIQATLDPTVEVNPSTGEIVGIAVGSVRGKYEGTPEVVITGGDGTARAEAIMSRVTSIPLSGVYTDPDQTAKWWMGVGIENQSAVYCVPYRADSILKIDASTTPATLTMVPSGGSLGGGYKWRDGVYATDNAGNDCVYCIPYNDTQVLKINATQNVATKLGQSFNGSEKWSAGAFAEGRVWGVPWAAATILVIDPQTDTSFLRGSTGMTPMLTNSAGTARDRSNTDSDPRIRVLYGGRGYVEAPNLTVESPDNTNGGHGGDTIQIEAEIELTQTVTHVAIQPENQGSGYSSSPTIQFFYGTGGPYVNKNPIADSPSPFKATMELDDTGYGYKITGITMIDGGDGIGFDRKPQVNIIGGKGTTAIGVALVEDRKVFGITIPNGFGGSGYTDWEHVNVEIRGGGGSGARAIVEKANWVPPVYANDGNGYLRVASGGYLTGTLRVTDPGLGYTSTPTVIISGGKGTDASIEGSDVTYTQDGKIVELQIPSGFSGGSGYRVESETDAGNSLTRHIEIALPTDNGVQGRAGGQRALARISKVIDSSGNAQDAIGSIGSISEITLVNCGSGYVQNAAISIIDRNGSSGADSSGMVAVFAPDGRIKEVATKAGTEYSRYTQRPTIDGLDVRDQSGAATPGGVCTAAVFCDGRASSLDQPSPYKNNHIPSGAQKFVSATAYDSGTSSKIFSFPWWTHRALRIEVPASTSAVDDTGLCFDVDDVLNYGGYDPQGFGRGYGLYSAAVETLGPDNKRIYGVPYNQQVVAKITASSNALEYIDLNTGIRRYRGRWLDGVAAYNGCIYCMPADSNSLLVIDTQTERKTEMVTFTNIRGQQNQKWWSAVMSGETRNEAMIYGIPSDLNQVLELNPGIPLRSKSLPSLGVVANAVTQSGVANVLSGNLVVYPPGAADGARHVTVYNADTDALTQYPIPAEGNCTFVEGVFMQDGNVIFIPAYNSTDEFSYEGRVGIFNVEQGQFTFSEPQVVPFEAAPGYPSRSCVRLSTNNTRILWIPKDGTDAFSVYDHTFKKLLTSSDPPFNSIGKATRSQDQIDVASATLIGDALTGSKVVTTMPVPTIATVIPGTNQMINGEIGCAVLSKRGAVILVPGYGYIDIQILYPDQPLAPRDVLAINATEQSPVTLVEVPDFIQKEQAKINAFRFRGAVRYDETIFCIPLRYNGVMTVTESYDDETKKSTYVVSEITTTQLIQKYNDGGHLYWGGILAGNGKIYCIPYDADQVMVIDPTEPYDKISFMSTNVNTGLAGTGSTGDPITRDKWMNATLLPDGRIVAAPYMATSILVIDPSNDAVSSIDVSGQSWATTTTERYCDVLYANSKIHFIPHNAQSIVSMDVSSFSVTETDLKVGIGGRKFWKATLSTNGRIYCMPLEQREVFEFNPVTLEVEKFGQFSYGDNSNLNKYGSACLALNGNIYGFGHWRRDVVEIVPFSYAVDLINTVGIDGDLIDPQYATIATIPRPYFLRPFRMAYDPEYVMFHTNDGSSIVNANIATSSFGQVVSGPQVRDGIASHYPETNDVVVTAFANTYTKMYPFEGGIAGVKSFSGTADLMCSIQGQDIQFRLGDSSVGITNIFETLFPESAAGVFSAYGSANTNTASLYVRTIPVGDAPYTYAGQTGTTFSVGRIDGVKTSGGGYNTPGFKQGFNGLISELVVFSSDQRARATTLGESSSFYYLDSSDIRLITLNQ